MELAFGEGIRRRQREVHDRDAPTGPLPLLDQPHPAVRAEIVGQ
ncbi:MAG: hypothetical protein WKF38_05680 [Candidatus Limnocylindrales bacterium]